MTSGAGAASGEAERGARAGVVDLRSDTVTRPTPAMRAAIAGAEVGDDTLGDDPTVQRLEARVAELLGKEAALFFPSGIMANLTAVTTLAAPGTELVVEATGHVLDWEMGGVAAVGGIVPRAVPTPDGLLDAALVRAAIRPPTPHRAATGAIALENTHNAAGGRILPPAAMRAIRAVAAEFGVPVHLDGARLWHASAATGVAEREYAACADTVMVTLSKALGCPVGSMLAGDAATIARARLTRRRLGGSMRQAGVLAAAGLYALEHHRARLGEDHRRARALADGLADLPGVRVIVPETNIVMAELDDGLPDAQTMVRRAAERGVLIVRFTERRVRAVPHLDVDDAGIDRAITVLRAIARG
jgi:threonine aldolase